MVQSWHSEAGLPVPGAGSSSYCRARQRLSKEFLDGDEEMVAKHGENVGSFGTSIVSKPSAEPSFNSWIRLRTRKKTLDVIAEFRRGFHGLQNRPRNLARRMLMVADRLVERIIVQRPGRREPRAVKRRPKPHQYLTSHRSGFQEILHRSHYRAAA